MIYRLKWTLMDNQKLKLHAANIFSCQLESLVFHGIRDEVNFFAFSGFALLILQSILFNGIVSIV